MPDTTTRYFSESANAWIRVCDMHDAHASNALRRVLSDPAHAAKQFSNPVFVSEVNQNLHAKAGGLGWVCLTQHPVPPSSKSARDPDTVSVPFYASRRDQARALMRVHKAAGLRSAFYRITDAGVLQKSR